MMTNLDASAARTTYLRLRDVAVQAAADLDIASSLADSGLPSVPAWIASKKATARATFVAAEEAFETWRALDPNADHGAE